MALQRSRKLLIGLVGSSLSVLSALVFAPATPGQEAKKDRPHIDLAFCIDTTGSMQSEIDNVKTKTKEIVAKLAGAKPTPDIRVGLVAYRDRGDQYVTKVFPFTQDIDHMVKDISDLKADGGGDAPESVNEALHVAVHDLAWSGDKKTLKMLFLIGDAGPHFYPNDYDWHTEAKTAAGQGIQINTIGCQGLEAMAPAEGLDVWKSIAKLADGKFEPLSYRHEVAQAGGRKETFVSSAGRMYKVDAAAAKDWREGAEALVSERRASTVAGSAVAGMAAASPMASLRSARPMSYAYAAAPAAQALDSRTDNNLADLVLSATREAAKKKLNVDFSAK